MTRWEAGSAAAVVCASAGNLGQALGWSGRCRGVDVTVVARRLAPAVKLERIRSFGAHLELADGDFETARERAATIARRRGVRLVEDSLDLETCEGAATIGLELVVEPSAALGVAAVLEDPDRFAGRHVVTIVCGGNVDLDAYHRWVAR
uniref:pyridoxal-phosphate dependent enzyme n=1 Tax=Paractinoplanes polyasparticus TaxID=2856853 RepID=UPI0027DFA799|nr:pyridoxal-phosphate dependent enzyme [Actinoplanes polyasparticus]